MSSFGYRTLRACQIALEHPPLHSVNLEVFSNSTNDFAKRDAICWNKRNNYQPLLRTWTEFIVKFCRLYSHSRELVRESNCGLWLVTQIESKRKNSESQTAYTLTELNRVQSNQNGLTILLSLQTNRVESSKFCLAKLAGILTESIRDGSNRLWFRKASDIFTGSTAVKSNPASFIATLKQ